MAQVLLEDVVKKFDSRLVVDHVSLDVSDGEFVVLVGPSGCGKTTTLRIIAGLERLSSGVVTIGGRPVNELSPKDRDIAMVFQNYALYSHLNVHDNLMFALKSRRVPKADLEQRISDVAEMLGLKDLLKRRPRQLSGGERQRVALGRAIVRQPQAFLMDEPLSNLDAILRLHMRKDLIELTRRLGSTVIYVTHDQVEAMTMGHRVGVMKDGKLLQTGTPSEVYARPANRFVAGFIGTPPMNFFTCEIAAGRDGSEAHAGGVRLDRVPDWIGGLGRVVVGVRPADVAMSEESAGFPVVVTVAENLGGEALVYADADGQTISFIVPTETSPHIGDRVWLRPRPDRLHFFDAETGGRLQ